MAAQRQHLEKRLKSYAPLSWWKFNEAVAATTIIDYGSTPHNITSVGAQFALGRTGPTPSIPGDTAVKLDPGGVLQGSLTAGAATDYQLGTTSFTFGCFVQYVTVGTKGFHGQTKIGAAAGWRLTLTCSSRLWGVLVNDGTGNLFTSTVTHPNDTNWHLVAVVVDRTLNTVRTHMDGVSAASLSITGKIAFDNTTSVLSVISQNTTSDCVMNYAHAFLINKALTDAELKAIFKDGTR
jgi:hypothetical protein